jgi:hypothetical protein
VDLLVLTEPLCRVGLRHAAWRWLVLDELVEGIGYELPVELDVPADSYADLPETLEIVPRFDDATKLEDVAELDRLEAIPVGIPPPFDHPGDRHLAGLLPEALLGGVVHDARRDHAHGSTTP